MFELNFLNCKLIFYLFVIFSLILTFKYIYNVGHL